MNFPEDAQFLGQLFEMRLKRSFAGNDELGFRKFFLENGERAERSSDTLFRDQPARLHETPATVGRRVAANKRKFVERNAGPIDPEAFGRATQREQPFRQRL